MPRAHFGFSFRIIASILRRISTGLRTILLRTGPSSPARCFASSCNIFLRQNSFALTTLPIVHFPNRGVTA